MALDFDAYMFNVHKTSINELKVKGINTENINVPLSGKHNTIVTHKYKFSDFALVPTSDFKVHQYAQDYYTFTLYIKKLLSEIGFSKLSHYALTNEHWNYDCLDILPTHPDRDLVNSFHFTEIDETSSKLSLATHTTASIYRHYSQMSQKFTSNTKYYVIGTVFRRQREDLTHFIQFNQLEFNMCGNYTIEDFKNVFTTLFDKLNIPIFFKRSIYPYTEPSFDICTIYNDREIELGGGGIFRQSIKSKAKCKVNMYGSGIGLERLYLVKNKLSKLSEINEV